MGQDIPKQFINVYDKPIIVYTMEVFQKHPNIDGIVVVCKEGWLDILRAYANQFNITKLIDVVKGGETGQESIINGLKRVVEDYNDDDIVIIHDGNRPLVTEEIISDNIAQCIEYGNAITAIPCVEVMCVSDDKIESTEHIDRNRLLRTQTPHSFKLGEVWKVQQEAIKKGITDCAATNALYIDFGKKIYFSAGSEKNLKITTLDDLEIFKALLNTKKAEWLK
jgi:2-C-methyl-D-erythritol 4-phosphate cytidylyltransferase